MRWYDLFSHTYDLQLEATYRPWRVKAVAILGLTPGMTVLDLGCGTGQNLDLLVDAVGPEGHVIGIDLSSGMLAKARQRVANHGWTNVTLLEGDVTQLAAAGLPAALDGRPLDAVLETVVLTAVPDWQAAFHQAWDALAPGGVFGMMDVYAQRRSIQTCLVEWIARADLNRTVWRELEDVSTDFVLDMLPAPQATFGGTLFVAVGRKG